MSNSQVSFPNKEFCFAFYSIVGGEVFSTKEDKWVVSVGKELFNENGRVNVELSGRINAEYTSLRMSGWTQYYDDVIEMYNDHESEKVEKIVSKFIVDGDFQFTKRFDANNFFMKHKHKKVLLKVFSEDELNSSAEDFLNIYNDLSKRGAVPFIHKSNIVLYEGHTKYAYVILDYYNIRLNKLKLTGDVLKVMEERISTTTKIIENEEYLDVDYNRENLLYDNKAKKIYIDNISLVNKKKC